MIHDTTFVREYITDRGLQVDEESLAVALKFSDEESLSQRQFDLLVVEHTRIVKKLFSPKRYSWTQRFFIALHFIFNFRRAW